jgi:pilus assembly protein CpaB
MNRRRYLIIGALALLIGFLVSVIAYQKMQAMAGSRESRVEVIVAAHDLKVGAKVQEQDIRIIKIAAADLPPGAPRRRADMVGHGVIVPISKGEFILPNRLAGENAGAGLPSLIPPGMRAVSLPVNDAMVVDGFAGERVDVLLTITMPGG